MKGMHVHEEGAEEKCTVRRRKEGSCWGLLVYISNARRGDWGMDSMCM